MAWKKQDKNKIYTAHTSRSCDLVFRTKVGLMFRGGRQGFKSPLRASSARHHCLCLQRDGDASQYCSERDNTPQHSQRGKHGGRFFITQVQFEVLQFSNEIDPAAAGLAASSCVMSHIQDCRH